MTGRIQYFGKIIQMFPIREFEKNGRSGKVANFRIADETGSCRTVLWDTIYKRVAITYW